MMTRPLLSRMRLWPVLALAAFTVLSPLASSVHAQRYMENLGRGVVAVRSSNTDVFISWRLLGLDPTGIGFNVYRGSTKLNASVLTGGTNFTDTGANLSAANAYTVRPVIGGVEQAASGAFTLRANAATEPLVRVPLGAPPSGYTTKFIWVGDLDGDGEYDYVIDRLAPFDPTNNDIGLGNQFLEGYRRDGTRLWRIDMGPNSRNTYNIEPGSSTLSMGMYDGATVYDLNNDGKAEVILKIANGVKFPDGTTFTNSNNLLQFLAVIDGQTGNMITNIAFPTEYLADGSLGTQLGVGYPDGVNPHVYLWGRNRVGSPGPFNDVFACYRFDGTTLSQRWKLLVPAGTPNVAASHQMRIADVDGDGTDEMMTGNMCVNANGTMRYNLAGIGHGDRFYVAKLDPTRPGLQGYGIQQHPGPPYILEYYYDANTGSVLWTHNGQAGDDIGRGIVGDVDPNFLGYEVWSFVGLHNGRSNQLISPDLYPYPVHTFWWDGDITSENLNDHKFEKWDPAHPTPTNAAPRLLLVSDYGAVISNHNPMFLGDIMGDWRSEVICLNADHSELMIFTTNIPSTNRIYTMPHNPAYRTHMTVKGYLQSPLLDYYLGAGMSPPPVPNIRYVNTTPPVTGTTIQGESAVIAGGVTIDSDRVGFNGAGFLNFPPTGGSAQFNGIDGGTGGAKTITIRYSNGASAGARTARILINGVAQNITFAKTTDWVTWVNLNVTVTLASGTSNIIRLESTGQDMGNIDQITVP